MGKENLTWIVNGDSDFYEFPGDKDNANNASVLSCLSEQRRFILLRKSCAMDCIFLGVLTFITEKKAVTEASLQ